MNSTSHTAEAEEYADRALADFALEVPIFLRDEVRAQLAIAYLEGQKRGLEWARERL